MRPELHLVAGDVPASQASWTAVATKGTAAPTASTTTAPTFTVTGAATGPETAAVKLRAVSRGSLAVSTSGVRSWVV